MTEKRRRIVSIDDDEQMLEMTKFTLENTGRYAVTAFNSVAEALKQIESLKPDLVVLDVMMPEMNGMHVFRRIREKNTLKETPIIFMTSQLAKESVEEYRTLGSTAVIPKPFEPEELPYQVDFLLGVFSKNRYSP